MAEAVLDEPYTFGHAHGPFGAQTPRAAPTMQLIRELSSKRIRATPTIAGSPAQRQAEDPDSLDQKLEHRMYQLVGGRGKNQQRNHRRIVGIASPKSSFLSMSTIFISRMTEKLPPRSASDPISGVPSKGSRPGTTPLIHLSSKSRA